MFFGGDFPRDDMRGRCGGLGGQSGRGGQGGVGTADPVWRLNFGGWKGLIDGTYRTNRTNGMDRI